MSSALERVSSLACWIRPMLCIPVRPARTCSQILCPYLSGFRTALLGLPTSIGVLLAGDVRRTGFFVEVVLRSLSGDNGSSCFIAVGVSSLRPTGGSTGAF